MSVHSVRGTKGGRVGERERSREDRLEEGEGKRERWARGGEREGRRAREGEVKRACVREREHGEMWIGARGADLQL